MALYHARSMMIHWEQKRGQGISTATVEVEHDDGMHQYLTVQILSSSGKFAATPQAAPMGFMARPDEDSEPEEKKVEEKKPVPTPVPTKPTLTRPPGYRG